MRSRLKGLHLSRFGSAQPTCLRLIVFVGSLIVATSTGSMAPSEAVARTWVVTQGGAGDVPTIQSGIEAASSGDTVLVEAGTYFENIHFVGHDIVVTSVSGSSMTTIDGSSHQAPVVEITQGESVSAVLSGFTIRGGTGRGVPGWGHAGGGLLIIDSEPTIQDNLIEGNVADNGTSGYGGGIFALGISLTRLWHPRIEGNEIRDNSAARNGGGVGIENSMAPSILGNTVTGNHAVGGDGGGVWILVHTPATAVEVHSNLISANAAGDHGGGLYLATSTGIRIPIHVTLNVIDRNVADGRSLTDTSGGGLWISTCSGTVANNTIVRNSGADYIQGGGMILSGVSNFEVSFNIIALTAVAGGLVCIDSDASIHDNLAWMNGNGDGGGECHEWAVSNGNIRADPAFCSVSDGVFSVASDSPALLHPGGIIGAFGVAGCPGTPVRASTWSTIKALFLEKH